MNALGCARGELDILDLKVINRAVAEFSHAACVFKPYRNARKLSIFGSARVTDSNPYYNLAVKLARLAVDNGFMVITGAAEGIMKAGNEGAGPEHSFGVNILLPNEQGPNRIIRNDPKVVRFKYFFTRKIYFVMEADAIALFPRRLRHPRRGLRGADPPPDGQSPADAGGADGASRRKLLGELG